MKKWLKAILSCLLCIMTMFGTLTGCVEKDDGMCTVTFDLCTDLQTNPVLPKEVAKGETVYRPAVAVSGDNPNKSEVEGWYLDKEYTQPWSFSTDVVETDITLYAKWINNYTVYYYLGDETEKEMFKTTLREGSMIIPDQTLSDGYRSDGFFADPEHTQPFVPHAIEQDTKIYIQRSNEFYFSGKMIAERFKPQASPSGAGSTAGSITLGGEGDEQYADVNFGYSTAADPHILLQNVTVDISHSKKIRVTMKNLGEAKSLKFYFVACYNKWNDMENKEFVGEEYFTEACAYTYTYTDDQKKMKESDPWMVIDIDITNGLLNREGSNGISSWGVATTLLKLRIDSGYVSKSEDDLSNRLLIKSIEGLADPSYPGLSDSAAVKSVLVDDNATEVQAAASAQKDIVGWVFPKDNAAATPVVEEGKVGFTTYQKKNGLLLYAPFRTNGAKLELAAGAEEISLVDNTTLVIRLRNFGYATTLKATWVNRYSPTDIGREGTETFTIFARSEEVVEYEFNMSRSKNWAEFLHTLTLEYTSVGVDNAILIESIEFKPYKAADIAGFNFDDRNMFGLTTVENVMEVSYNASDYATRFKVLDDTQAVVNKNLSGYRYFTNAGYQLFTLSYKQKKEGVSKVNVYLTVDGQEQLFAFEVGASNKLTTVDLPITKGGNISNFRMTFEGNGDIYIASLRFKANNPIAWDFGASAGFEKIKSANKDWSKTGSYDNGLSALALAPCGGSEPTKYYYGAAKMWGKSETGNVPLADKTKVVIVYYNPGTVSALAISIGWTEMVDYEEEGVMKPWDEKIVQPGGTGGSYHVNLETNMKAGEWAYAEIDLSMFKGLTAEERVNKAIGSLFVCHWKGKEEKDTVYIRLLSII